MTQCAYTSKTGVQCHIKKTSETPAGHLCLKHLKPKAIRAKILEAGWSEEQLDNLIDEVKNGNQVSTSPPKQEAKKEKKIKIIKKHVESEDLTEDQVNEAIGPTPEGEGEPEVDVGSVLDRLLGGLPDTPDVQTSKGDEDEFDAEAEVDAALGGDEEGEERRPGIRAALLMERGYWGTIWCMEQMMAPKLNGFQAVLGMNSMVTENLEAAMEEVAAEMGLEDVEMSPALCLALATLGSAAFVYKANADKAAREEETKDLPRRANGRPQREVPDFVGAEPPKKEETPQQREANLKDFLKVSYEV